MESTLNTGTFGFNFLIAVVCAAIFAVTVTNCIVYARIVKKNSETTEPSLSGVSKLCTKIMLGLNIIASIGSMLCVLYFGYRIFFDGREREEHIDRISNVAKSIYQAPTVRYASSKNF